MKKLILSALLAFTFLLSPLQSFAALKDRDTCAANAQMVAQFIQLKDQGISKKDLLDMIDWSELPKEYQQQMTKDIKKAIDLVYSNPKANDLVILKKFLTQCVKEPVYQKEVEA